MYADWLDDRGRDREAATVRRFLPEVQLAVRAGADLPAVMLRVARQDPDGPGWGGHAEPARPADPPPRLGPERVVYQRVDRDFSGWRKVMWLPPVLIAVSSVMRVATSGHRAAGPPPAARDAGPPPTAVGAGRWTADCASPVPWDPAELTGYALRLADGRTTVEFRFTGPETVVTSLDGPAGTVRRMEGSWWVDAVGALTVSGPDGRREFVLAKVAAVRDRYEVKRDGRQETYAREKLAGAADRP